MLGGTDANMHCHTRAFTLIELSIVLVTIGLIVGGVLVGRDLIAAAAVRAQIAQIDAYQTAINTFKGKYRYLPGDIPDPDASSFGFAARGQFAGEGDGNDYIEGVNLNGAGRNFGWTFSAGETQMFWVDLSAAHLIPGNFTLGSSTNVVVPIPSTALTGYFPLAKLGQGNFVYAYGVSSVTPSHNGNFLCVSVVLNTVAAVCGGCMNSNPGMTVRQAYAIDSKIDDGTPLAGRVITRAPDLQTSSSIADAAYAATGSSTTCLDTSVTNGHYSIDQNNGSGVNCWLSFKF
jgi:hypothetical protein